MKNLMTPDHIIDVMLAYKKGKTIQKKGRYTGGWIDFDLRHVLRADAVQYRVKPERKKK